MFGFRKKTVPPAQDSDAGQRRAAANIFKFLAALLAFTLIARGTGGATLAKVNLSAPSRATIVEAVTGSATVSTANILEITVPEGITIAETLASTGQDVEIGDAVLRFDMDELSELLLRETADLEKKLFDLEKLERTETVDSSSLDSARRSLSRVYEDYNATIAQDEADIQAALEALEEALNESPSEVDISSLQTAIRSYQRTLEDYNSTMAQSEADIKAAQDELDSILQEEMAQADNTSLQNAQRTYQRAREDYDASVAQSEAAVLEALYALEAAKNILELKYLVWSLAPQDADKEEDYRKAISDAQKAQNDYNSVLEREDSSMLSLQRKLEDAQTSLTKAENDYNNSVRQIAETRQADIERAESALSTAISRAEETKLSSDRKLEDSEISLRKAEQDYQKNLEQAEETVTTNIEKAQETLRTVQERAEENRLSADRRVEDAEISMQKAQQDYAKNVQQAQETAEQNRISATTLRLDIEEKRVYVDSLEKVVASEGVLYAEYAGVVDTISSEGTVTGKTPVITLRDITGGYEAQLQTTKDNADKLSIGGECEVTTGGGNVYYNPTVFGTISAISQPDDNDRVTITISLPDGNWREGQRIDAQVVISSGSYDQCVPVSALHSDNLGYYLYVVVDHNTILGLQSIVTRVDVTVSASDNDSASVRGAVGRDSRVITGSNKSVSEGDRVRVSE